MRNIIITKYSVIRRGEVSINGDKIYKDDSMDFSSFIKSTYKKANVNYSKFYKMDRLAKLGFLGAVLILKEIDSKIDDMAIVIAGSSSTLDTDKKYIETIQDKSKYFPNPALFVYTLPNIMIGEICIKYKIYGENSFFIFKKFSPDFLFNYIEIILNTGISNKVLTGWVDYKSNELYESVLYFVEKKDKGDNLEFTSNNLSDIYLKGR